MDNYDSNTLKIINIPSKFKPLIYIREYKLVKYRTGFFGLFNSYKLEYTEWVLNG